MALEQEAAGADARERPRSVAGHDDGGNADEEEDVEEDEAEEVEIERYLRVIHRGPQSPAAAADQYQQPQQHQRQQQQAVGFAAGSSGYSSASDMPAEHRATVEAISRLTEIVFGNATPRLQRLGPSPLAEATPAQPPTTTGTTTSPLTTQAAVVREAPAAAAAAVAAAVAASAATPPTPAGDDDGGAVRKVASREEKHQQHYQQEQQVRRQQQRRLRRQHRQVERVYRVLPQLSRLQQRLTSPTHAAFASSYGATLVLLAVLRFLMAAGEDGLPYLQLALSSLLTNFLPRDHAEAAVACEAASVLCAWAEQQHILASSSTSPLQQSLLLPQVFPLLLQMAAFHSHLIEHDIMGLLPHLVTPSTIVPLFLGLLDLPVLLMALKERVQRTRTTSASAAHTSKPPSLAGSVPPGSLAPSSPLLLGGSKGAATVTPPLPSPSSLVSMTNDAAIDAAEVMALMDATFTGTMVSDAVLDESGNEGSPMPLPGARGGRGDATAGASAMASLREARAALIAKLLAGEYEDAPAVRALWRTPGLPALLAAEAESEAHGSEELRCAMDAAPRYVRCVFHVMSSRLGSSSWLVLLPHVLQRYSLLLAHPNYAPKMRNELLSVTLDQLTLQPQLLTLLQGPIRNALTSPFCSHAEVELAGELIWAVGELSASAAAAAAPWDGDVHTPADPVDPAGLEGTEALQRVGKRDETVAARALFESIELLLFESLAARRRSGKSMAMGQDPSTISMGVATPKGDGVGSDSAEAQSYVQSSDLLLRAVGAIAKIAAAHWELNTRARISLLKVARAGAVGHHPLAAQQAEDYLSLMHNSPLLFSLLLGNPLPEYA